MSLWDAVRNLFVEDIGGSFLVVALLALVFIMMVLFLVRSTKPVFVAVIFLFLFFMSEQGFLPSWLFFLSLAMGGIYIAKGIYELVFSPRG